MFIIFIIISIFLAPFSAAAQTYSNSDVPLILPRALWENSAGLSELLQWTPEDKDPNFLEHDNPNSNDAIPDYAPVERIVIHDIGCPVKSTRCNSDIADAREIIQSIYRNHAAVRGWGDIGYHYLIDRKGNIYEGRYGGNGARGAHVYDGNTCRNFNVGTIGISLLGNYTAAPVPSAAFDSLARLVGWLSAVNGIEPDETAKTTLVWANPKQNGKCDATFGSFSASFTGPVVLGHNEIELANTDPGTLDMGLLRARARAWKEKYAGLRYQEQGAGEDIFAIEGGAVKKIADASAESGAENKIVKINSSQIALFPKENRTMFPEGTLVKSRTRGEIYAIEDGKRRHITSAELFQRLGYSLAMVRVLSDRELLGYAKGAPIVFPDGALLASRATGATYLVVNGGKKRLIISARAFAQRGLKRKNVITISDTELEAYPSDGVVGLPEGTLVSLSFKASAANYVIADGGKKIIPSWEMFDRWKFKRNKIIVISKKDFDLYPDKGALLLPDGSFAHNPARPELYLIFAGKKHWITQYATIQALKLQIARAVKLSAEDMARYQDGFSIASAQDWEYIKTGKIPPSAEKKTAALGAVKTDTAAREATAALSSSPHIRIGLFSVEKDENVSVSADKSFTMAQTQKAGEKQYAAGEIATVNWNAHGNTIFTAKETGAIFTIASYSLYNWNKTINFNSFRGSIELSYSPASKKVWVVNELPLEDYLAGIGEALNTDHGEYQKAFSIAARSYALFHLRNGGKYGADEAFHLNSSSSDQVYKGYVWEQYAPRLAEASRATAGEAMYYNGKVARALYSSDSGGVTKNACAAFAGEFCSADYGYLSGGVKDPEGTLRRDAVSLKLSHGVGMSATGARRAAELGKNYKDILAYYYKGIEIKKIY